MSFFTNTDPFYESFSTYITPGLSRLESALWYVFFHWHRSLCWVSFYMYHTWSVAPREWGFQSAHFGLLFLVKRHMEGVYSCQKRPVQEASFLLLYKAHLEKVWRCTLWPRFPCKEPHERGLFTWKETHWRGLVFTTTCYLFWHA